MKEAQLLKIIIEERALVKLLKVIGENDGDLYTRQLLKTLGEWGYGHELLIKAESNGLITRKQIKNKIYNRLTNKGKQVVKLVQEVGI